MIFSYQEAFSRNIGWLSEYEQQLIRQKTVAIAGMGGVGGVYFLTCVRLGIENFHISDFDIFEVGNFNRQVGATLSSFNKKKADTLKIMPLDINPNCNIKVFANGIDEENIQQFLEGVDLYIDGIDLFAMKVRRLIFSQCHNKKIPAITAAPLGMSTAYMIFTESSTSFENYFDFKNCANEEDVVTHFAFGMSPAGLHRSYLMDESRVHFAAQKGPSTIMGCQLCAGVAATEALKILLNRGNVYGAPHVHQFDAYKNRYKRIYIPFGNKNPLQKLKIKIAKSFIADLSKEPYPYNDDTDNPIENIVNLAKWAPSGHNEQVCSSSILPNNKLKITVKYTQSPFNKHETQRVTLNMLGIYLETLDHSAHFYGYTIVETKKIKAGKDRYTLEVELKKSKKNIPNLGAYVKARFTDRRAYKTKKITKEQKLILEKTLEKDYSFIWKENLLEKAKAAIINAKSMKLELQHPFFYEDLKNAIHLKTQFSSTGIPDKSFNLDVLTRSTLKKILGNKELYQKMNTKFGGFIAPVLQTSIIPDTFSGAHVLFARKEKDILDTSSKEFINQGVKDGRMIQRFWLTATSLGLVLQPTHIQLVFAREPKGEVFFGIAKKTTKTLHDIRKRFLNTHGIEPENTFFSARLGTPKNRRVYARSTRKV